MTERDHLAAELALGLLEGAELLEARGLMASDADFAHLVAAWEERFSPLFDEFRGAEPPAEMKERILRSLEFGDGNVVVTLRKRLGWWKGAAAVASAVAASLALVVAYDVTRPPPPVARPAPAEMMVASLMSPDQEMMLSATWLADRGSLMLTPGDMPPEPGRSHELWIIPADGTPRSLGLVQAEQPSRMDVPAPLQAQFAGGATLAISIEPAGGSPAAGPTGPVVASGVLSKV